MNFHWTSRREVQFETPLINHTYELCRILHIFSTLERWNACFSTKNYGSSNIGSSENISKTLNFKIMQDSSPFIISFPNLPKRSPVEKATGTYKLEYLFLQVPTLYQMSIEHNIL